VLRDLSCVILLRPPLYNCIVSSHFHHSINLIFLRSLASCRLHQTVILRVRMSTSFRRRNLIHRVPDFVPHMLLYTYYRISFFLNAFCAYLPIIFRQACGGCGLDGTAASGKRTVVIIHTVDLQTACGTMCIDTHAVNRGSCSVWTTPSIRNVWRNGGYSEIEVRPIVGSH